MFGQYVNPNADIINAYAKVIEFPSCSSCLGNCDVVKVDDASDFKVSDRVLLIQMKGADISWADDSTFGEIIDYRSAGFHELMQIKSVNGNELQFTNAIQASYNVDGCVQVVKIVEIKGDYIVGSDGITCAYWNGNTGGVLYLEVAGTLTLNGDVDVRGRGFRGAQNPNENADITHCGTAPMVNGKVSWANGVYTIDLANIQYSGRKGEGIAEFRNPENELGLGPLGNGGGGGNNHNAGGGGGSNMGGGGHGGHEYDYLNRNCGHDLRGVGGKELDRLGGLRLFLGGGGGAGHENNNVGTSGGSGGGIIILKATKIEGNGHKIIADGTRGPRYVRDSSGVVVDSSSYVGGNDGCGGGGGGGSIKLECDDFSDNNLIIQARGSDGGDMGNLQHGPGGGGGGGLVCFTTMPNNTLGIQITSEGGKAGVTNDRTSWGAESGGDGLTGYECSSLATPPPRQLHLNIGPDLYLCNPPSGILDSKESEPLYIYNWFKDGVPIAGATSPTYEATDAGTYSLELLSPNCPPAYDTAIVSKAGNESPVDSVFCNENGPQSVELSIDNPTMGANYGWYDAPKAGNLLFVGKTYKTVPLNTTTQFFVEDTNKIRATIGPLGNATLSQVYYVGDPVTNTDVTVAEHSSSFTALASFVLKSVEVEPANNAGGCGNPGAGTTKQLTVVLYKDGKPTSQKVTETVSCDGRTRMNLNFSIDAGFLYTLVIDGVQNGDVLMEKNAPVGDEIPDIIRIEDHVNVSGPFFNWIVEYGSPCGRIPVTATLFCIPCKKPKPLVLKLSNATGYLCGTESSTIETNNQYTASDYEFLWYRSVDTTGNRIKTDSGSASSSQTVTGSDKGVYAVLVRDKQNWQDSSCWSFAKFTLDSYDAPSYAITGAKKKCEYEDISPLELTLTGTAPWKLNVSDFGDTIANSSTIAIDNPSNGTYNVLTISDKYCSGVSMASKSVAVDILPRPGKPVVAKDLQSIYQGQKIPEFSATGKNITWQNVKTGVVLGSGTSFTPAVTDTGRYVFDVIAEDAGCTDTSKAVLLVSGCPSPVPLPNSKVYCYGETEKPEISAQAKGSGTLYWFSDFVFTKANALASGNTLQTNDVKPGVYTYYVSEFDPLEVCFGPYQEVSVTIAARPDGEVLIDSVLCAGQGAKEVSVHPSGGSLSSVDAPAGIAGVGTVSDPFLFDPMFGGFVSGDYSLEYTYSTIVDVLSGKTCDTTVARSFHVQATPAVAPIDTQKILTTANIPSFSAVGENVVWYFGSAETQTDVFTPFELKGKVGTYVFDVTQTIRGCESEKEQAVLEIVLCDAHKPTVVNSSKCIGYTDVPELLVSSGGNVTWFSGPSEKTTKLGTGSSYIPKDADAGSHYYYVAEYDAGNDCWGEFATAEFTVNELPDVSVSAPDTICSDGPAVEIETDPGSVGTFVENGGMTGSYFDPSTWGEKSGIHRLIYEYKHNITGCVNRDTASIFVQFTPVPSTTDGGGLTVNLSLVDPIAAVGDNIAWYDSVENLLPRLDGMKAVTPAHSNAGDYIYYATQTIAGCESKKEPAVYSLSDCPAPRPDISDASICVADGLPEFVATQGMWKIAQQGASEFRWYDKQSGLVEKKAIADKYAVNSSYKGIDGVYEFSVAEFDLFNQCEGPAKDFKLTILSQKKPVLHAEKADICIYENDIDLNASVSNGTVRWYSDAGLSTLIGTGNSVTIPLIASGAQTFYATDEDVCTSLPTQVSFTVHDRPSKPIVVDAEDCFGAMPQAKISMQGSNPNWYDSNKSSLGETGADFESPKTNVGTHTFYVTQTDAYGCESDFTEATYFVLALPAKVVAKDQSVCENLPMVSLTCNGDATNTIEWKDNKGNSYQGITIVPVVRASGTYTFSITQTDTQGCMSPEGSVQLEIYPQPIAPDVDDVDNCQGAKAISLKAVAEKDASVRWMSGTGTSDSVIATGKAIVPKDSTIGRHNYYALQESKNGCISPVTTAKYTIVETPEPPVVNALSTCEGDEVGEFYASHASGSVSWYLESSQNALAIGTDVFQPSEENLRPGFVSTFFAVTHLGACQSEPAKALYNYRFKPALPIATATIVCQGKESSVLSVRAYSDSVMWVNMDGYVVEKASPIYEPDQDTIGLFTYRVSQIINGCKSDEALVNFRIAPIPDVVLEGDTLSCYPSLKNAYTIANPDTAYDYDWVSTGKLDLFGGSESNKYTRFANYFGPMIDTVVAIVSNSYGCKDTSALVVYVAEDPVADFTHEVSTGVYTIFFTNLSEQENLSDGETMVEVPMEFYWDFGLGLDTLTYQPYTKYDSVQKEFLLYNQFYVTSQYPYGDYDVTLYAENSFGCRDSITQTIHMEIATGFYVPTAFAPGYGARFLEVFRPFGYNLQSYTMTVYDNWGNIIWSSSKLTEDGQPSEFWDGRDKNGNLLPAGTYTWRADVSFKNGRDWEGNTTENGKQKRYGSVVLIR